MSTEITIPTHPRRPRDKKRSIRLVFGPREAAELLEKEAREFERRLNGVPLDHVETVLEVLYHYSEEVAEPFALCDVRSWIDYLRDAGGNPQPSRRRRAEEKNRPPGS